MSINWRLVFGLSLFGLAMAITTIAVIPSQMEPVFWLVIFLFCANVIGRRAREHSFIHGLLVGIANSVWVTAAHVTFFHQYLAHHAREAAMMSSMPMPDRPRLMMLLIGPMVGIISGVIIGLLALVSGRLFGRREAQQKA